MLNLIKKDFIVSIKGEGKGLIKYILLYLFMYIFFNESSYFVTPIFVSYLILANTFYNDYKNNNMNYVNSIPISKEDIVYSKYLLSVIVMITTLVICYVLNLALEPYLHRGNVLYDIYYSIIAFSIIVSVALPIYFKFGYHKVRIIVGFVSIVIFYLTLIPMDILGSMVYYSANGDIAYGISYAGPLSNTLNTLINMLNQLNLSKYTMEIMLISSLLIMILSMYISLKIVNSSKTKKYKINISSFTKVSAGVVGMIIVVALISIFIFKDLKYSEAYRDKYSEHVEFVVEDQEYINGELNIKIKINNPTKYTFRLEKADLAFEILEHENSEGFIISNLKLELSYSGEEENGNSRARFEGVPPKSSEIIEYTIPKGIYLDSKYFLLDNMDLNYEGTLVSKLPFLQSGYITVDKYHSGSTNVGIILLEELNVNKKGE